MPLLVVLLVAAAPPLPQQFNDPKTSEGWIWQRVQAGDVADLNDRCGTTPPLDIHKDKDAKWQASCRRVDPDLLRALLTQPDLADHAPHGVRIRGARIDGNLDLSDSHIRAAEVWLEGSWIAGGAQLDDARLDGGLSFNGSLVEGGLRVYRAFIGGFLNMSGADLRGRVGLRDAHVDGQMDMEGASVAAEFDAERLHVGAGGLFLRNVKFGGRVALRTARVDGQMSMVGASVAEQQTFDAERLHVGAGGLFLRDAKFGGPVVLVHAHVEGQMSMVGASVAEKQIFDASLLNVGAGGLFLRDAKFGGPVVLAHAHVGGQMDIEGASVAEKFTAELLLVGAVFLARSATFGGEVNFQGLGVGGSLDLRDSHVREVRLGGAVIRDDLLFGGRYDDGSEGWILWDRCDSPAPCLDLRNARVGNLQDDERAWPKRITLEGFSYTHLGGIGGAQRQDMRARPIDWWRDWLNRDPVYSAQPYAQLAGFLASAGNREGAADIRFFGRDRERSELLRGCTWLQKLGLVETADDSKACRWAPWIGLSALQVFVGYGIGNYSFRAVGWALVLAFLGVVILWFAPGVRGVRPANWTVTKAGRGPRQKSFVWCIGASLHRVLPVISISKEFGDFFDDPNRERLRGWQHFMFAVLALCGWALAPASGGLLPHDQLLILLPDVHRDRG
jgi:hypothetical protein